MTRFLITTVCRHSGPGEPSGFLCEVDLDSSRLLNRCPVTEPDHLHDDPNPRGGLRGARGIGFRDGIAYVANHSSVLCYDESWNPVGEISHPSCASVHDIFFEGEMLWVTSTRNDLLCGFDSAGVLRRHVNLRALPIVRDRLQWSVPNRFTDDQIVKGSTDFRDPRTHTYEKYDGAHVNSVCFLPSGAMLVLLGLVWSRGGQFLFTVKRHMKKARVWDPLVRLNRLAARAVGMSRPIHSEAMIELAKGASAVVKIERDGAVQVIRVMPHAAAPAHSLRTGPDGSVMMCDTNSGQVVGFDPQDGRDIERVDVGRQFLRGLHLCRDGGLLVGMQNRLVLLDRETASIRAEIEISGNPNECIFDVKPLPAVFGSLPGGLPDPRGGATVAG